MPRIKLYIKHLFGTFIFFALLVIALFESKNYIQDILANPENYFKSDLLLPDLHFAIVFILLATIVVLITYIFYLILTLNTRSELAVWNATKSLALSKEQFKRLYESAPVPYLLLDKNGNIRDPNKAALRFFEVVPEEIADKDFFSLFAPESAAESDKFHRYYKTGMPINRQEVQMMTKKNGARWVLLSIFEMKNPGSFSSTGLAVIFDITEQKLLDQTKTEFVSLASHQLRTPLATTKWFTEMLASGDLGSLTDKQKEYVDKLGTANEEMINLVDVLLNVSRIEMGKLSVESKPTNVEELSESVLSELSLQIDRKKIRIDKRYDGLLKNVKSDPKLLRIVIQNLIGNAVKYTSDDGEISIAFRDFGSEKQIVISDNGVGIPKAEQDKVFTKLFRAGNVRGLSGKDGTGLGLYLVKSVVDALGGKISFVSEENKGSTFTVTF